MDKYSSLDTTSSKKKSKFQKTIYNKIHIKFKM